MWKRFFHFACMWSENVVSSSRSEIKICFFSSKKFIQLCFPWLLLDFTLARLNPRSEYYRHFYCVHMPKSISNHIFNMFRFYGIQIFLKFISDVESEFKWERRFKKNVAEQANAIEGRKNALECFWILNFNCENSFSLFCINSAWVVSQIIDFFAYFHLFSTQFFIVALVKTKKNRKRE